jgi:hypothetical protein
MLLIEPGLPRLAILRKEARRRHIRLSPRGFYPRALEQLPQIWSETSSSTSEQKNTSLGHLDVC